MARGRFALDRPLALGPALGRRLALPAALALGPLLGPRWAAGWLSAPRSSSAPRVLGPALGH